MTKPFDLLAEFGKFGLERRLSLRDPATISAFIGHVGDRVEGAVGDSPLLHGQRTEAMFEALLISLGEFELLKGEDGGRLFPDDRYRVPDFRTVLKDGSHWLIEVKNVYEREPLEQRRRLFTGPYLELLTAYADATGAQLKIAVYWARWSIWTLVSPDRLTGPDGGLDLDMVTAMRVNELSRLGDRTIGTRSPLRLRLTMDEGRTSRIAADGEVTFVIGGVQIFCADKEIVEPAEQEIVSVFMQYGRWRADEPEAMGHLLMENANALIVDAALTRASGTAEREAALAMLGRRGRRRGVTLGADKAYDVATFVDALRDHGVTPHIAVDGHVRKTGKPRATRIDRRTTRHPGYATSQRLRKRIEEGFGWIKTTGGLAGTRHRGLDRVGWTFTLSAAAYNLVRLPKLLAEAPT